MKQTSFSEKTDRLTKWLFLILGILFVVVLVLSNGAVNEIHSSRPQKSAVKTENAICTRMEKAGSPAGYIEIYDLILKDVKMSDTLAFYINHHNVKITLENEVVYRAEESGRKFRTTGGIWVMLPLDEMDNGKELRIEITPLYKDYQDEITLFIGTEAAICKGVFLKALPEIILSLCTVFTGVFLLLMAAYYSIKHLTIQQLYAVGSLAVSAGIWRFTYGRFAYLLLPQSSVFVYTLSIVALMLIALSMLGCVEFRKHETWKKNLRYVLRIYCMIYIVQMVCQALGLYDLRQTLKIVHGTIILSAVILLYDGISAWFEKPQPKNFWERNYSWMMGIGVILDLLMYYFSDTSMGMLFTLSAILCFSMMESFKLLLQFTEQRTALEEMKIRLALSRTTTMMSQIRSHFVFNLLNAISGMCKYDPEKADETVVRFARYLRNNIDIMEDDRNILFTKDLRQLEDYVVLEQIRFGDKIEFYEDIEVDHFMIPPLILQPIVENAIKHGVSKKKTKGTIILATREEANQIVITVEDDGVGFDMQELEKEQSVGLKNIRFRLEHLVQGSLEIASRKGEGTKVTIRLPKEKKA